MNKKFLYRAKLFAIGVTIISIPVFTFPGCQSKPEKITEKNIAVNLFAGELPLDWFKEAKFGMFIHWGPYSRLAGEWNGQQVEVGKEAEWIMKELKIPVNNYRELAHEMNPVRFDAHEWVRLAKATGMKYIVITAKHHDGFAMYHSKCVII